MLVELNSSLVSQLKRALGDETMSTEVAIERSLRLAIECRGLKCALHDAVVEECGVIPVSAERHIDMTEVHYAWIRKSRTAK